MQETVITSRKSWKDLAQELWDYKEVFLFLGWRDILVHYKQTVIGVGWVILRPFLTVIIFTIIFSRIAGIESAVAPYPLVIFSGMLAWQFFVEMLTYGSQSYLSNGSLVSKIYIPRIYLPASRLLCSTVNFGIAFLFYLFLSFVRYRFVPSVQFFYFPLFFLWLSLVSFSFTLVFATLTVRYRDFTHLVAFVTQLGLYCTPIGFSLSMVPKKLIFLLAINPLVGVINGFRWTLIGEPFDSYACIISLLSSLVLVGGSIYYFKIAQADLADAL